MQRHCTKCGGKVGPENNFCHKCGAPTLEESLQADESLYLDNSRKALLSLFLKPRQLDREGWQMVWEESLGVEYIPVITQFIENGYLEKACVEDKLMAKNKIYVCHCGEIIGYKTIKKIEYNMDLPKDSTEIKIYSYRFFKINPPIPTKCLRGWWYF